MSNGGGAQPPAFVKQTPQTPREMSAFKNKIPFSDHMYDHLKFVVGVISAKMANPEGVLSRVDANKFVIAVAEIIEDAHMYGPPPRPQVMQGSQEEAESDEVEYDSEVIEGD